MIQRPPDRIPPNESKAERERRVFTCFAADAAEFVGFQVTPQTIASREPPEPDILCAVEGQGPVAFELVEILDQKSKQVMVTMLSAREVLYAYFDALADSQRRRFRSKFARQRIKVAFRQDRPLRSLKAVIPALYHWLIHQVPEDADGYAIPLPADLHGELEYVSILSPGPAAIDIAFGLNILDATLSALISKLTAQQYQTPAPIELLVYAHDQPLVEYEAKQALLMAHVVPLVDASSTRGPHPSSLGLQHCGTAHRSRH